MFLNNNYMKLVYCYCQECTRYFITLKFNVITGIYYISISEMSDNKTNGWQMVELINLVNFNIAFYNSWKQYRITFAL